MNLGDRPAQCLPGRPCAGRRLQHRIAVTALATSFLLAGCDGGLTPPATAVTAPTQSSVPSVAPTADGLSACPSPQSLASLPIVAHTDISPDDLLALPDGSLWVTDPLGGAVEHLAADGRVETRMADGQAPEGMVADGGKIVLAEQRPNRVVSFVPPSSTRSVLLSLPSRGSQEGVDGIGIDAASGRLLVPDSPHGTLLSAAIDGRGVVMLASGLGRDVGATVGSDGSIWVAVEGGHGLLRVPRGGGAAEAVGGLAQLDDVIAVGALLYATLIIAGEVVAIDPVTGADRVLATGAGAPQGLALLANGRLAVADSSSRVISSLATCGG